MRFIINIFVTRERSYRFETTYIQTFASGNSVLLILFRYLN